MAELLGRAGLMAVGAEAADVAVFVRSAVGKRHDVVRHSRLAHYPGAGTIPAEGLGAKAAQPLNNCRSPPEPFGHSKRPKRTTPGSW